MLSIEVYEQAKAKFVHKPIHLRLLNHIWNKASDFDFSTGCILKVPMPTYLVPSHEEHHGKKYLFIREKEIPCSHKTIRKVVSSIGLFPIRIQDKHVISLVAAPKGRSKNTCKKTS